MDGHGDGNARSIGKHTPAERMYGEAAQIWASGGKEMGRCSKRVSTHRVTGGNIQVLIGLMCVYGSEFLKARTQRENDAWIRAS